MSTTVAAIVPCYNCAAYIEETIESVLQQDYSDMEVVAIDDGSTDSTREILERFGSAVRILTHEGGINRGQSASINLGLAETHSDYVALLDSDDIWLPGKISEQVAYLDRHAQTGVVIGNGEAIDSDGKLLYRIYENGPPGDCSAESLLLNCYITIQNNAMFRRHLLEETGMFDETLRAAQDHDMILRLAEVSRISYVDRCWFRYRRHADSISYNRTIERWNNGFLILEKAIARYPYRRFLARKRKAVLHFRLAQCYRDRGSILAAAGHAVAAFAYDPVRSLGVIARQEKVDAPY